MTINEIKTAMTATFIQNERVQLLYGLQPGKTFEEEFSVYSLENILFDVVAFAIWTLESLFYILKNQIDALILANKHGKLELGSYTLREGFSVPVSWHQLREYETGDPANPTGIQKVLMFRENFQLSEAEMQNIWEEIGGTILATDNLAQKMDDFVTSGTLYWIGSVREIFGLDMTGFEVV